jgi:hypothetical protein
MYRTSFRSGRKVVLAVVITGTLAAGLVAGLVLAPRVTANRGQAEDGGKNGDAKVAPTQTEEEKPQIVVLGEFIGSQDGLGYLLNVAAIRFDMQSVMAYLCVVLIISALFEIGQSLVFSLFLTKYFYPP